MKKIIMVLVLVTVLLVGCGGVESEFGGCYASCRAKEYQKLDSTCDWIGSSKVRKYCNIEETDLVKIKDDCFEVCN